MSHNKEIYMMRDVSGVHFFYGQFCFVSYLQVQVYIRICVHACVHEDEDGVSEGSVYKCLWVCVHVAEHNKWFH